MGRWSKLCNTALCCVCFLVLTWQIPAARPQKVAAWNRMVLKKEQQEQSSKLAVKVLSSGPSQQLIEETKAKLPVQSVLQDYLRGTRYRLLVFESPESGKDNTLASEVFRAIYYDYTNNRTLRAEGRFNNIAELKVKVGNDQPLPSNEEYDAAISILLNDPTIGPLLAQHLLVANPAMPPVIYPETAVSGAGTVERTINVLLLPTDKSSLQTEVVGVNMVRSAVVHFSGGAPSTSKAASTLCGIPNAGQGTTSSGTAGQYQFVITNAGVELWSFLAIRPSASSGPGDRSGIELQNVKYKGKMLLKRMHAPILNIDYDGNACGPFRDWQWQEGMFQANGTDVPGTNGGVRDCGNTPATTALETGNDTGNFRGIAFYRQGNEVVLVSEMDASWYRYICEYRFDINGTIRPRYGFGATSDSCVCFAHTHHVYWRFDFDIDGNAIVPAANIVRPSRREFFWSSPYAIESRIQRGPRQNWLVQNPNTLDSYMIRPNSNDGTAAEGSYGKGDVWVLLFKSNEISDRDTGGINTGTAANLDGFMSSPESLVNGDVVVWYGAHFYHADAGNNAASPDIAPRVISGHHVVGPDLVPVRW